MRTEARGTGAASSQVIPRVFVDPGSHHALNLGDVGMLLVAVERLRTLWPGCRVRALTSQPEVLAAHAPSVEPLPAAGRYEWFDGVRRPLASRRDSRRLTTRAILALEQLGRRHSRDTATVLSALVGSDLVLIPGRGGLTSTFRDDSLAVLELVNLAANLGIPVAMVGQGVGPITDGVLRRRAAQVLPRVALLTLREGRHGPALLDELGVTGASVTGDEALALVQRHEPPGGGALGVNLRRSDYAGVDRHMVARVAAIAARCARDFGADRVPIAISTHPHESDVETGRQLSGRPGDDLPLDVRSVIDAVAGCRAVVAGSYHAAVFALGQGIPVVAVVGSQYYAWKMQGLARQFSPAGCAVVDLAGPALEERLAAAIRRAWEMDGPAREGLLQFAAEQVGSARAAWSTLPARLRLAYAAT